MFQLDKFGGDSISHGFFTRKGGVSTEIYDSLNCGLGSDDKLASVRENRAKAMASLKLPADALITCHQNHTSHAVFINNKTLVREPYIADGMATSIPGIALGILTADCSPVLFTDKNNRVIGAAHAGWKGALGGILESTISCMLDQGAQIDKIVTAIGPTIGPKSYEVGPEFPLPFLDLESNNSVFFSPSKRDNHFLFDLPGYINSRLTKIGLTKVYQLNCDTYTDEFNFYSYRRSLHKNETDYGRLLSTIAILP
jgi:YfiH family protein